MLRSSRLAAISTSFFSVLSYILFYLSFIPLLYPVVIPAAVLSAGGILFMLLLKQIPLTDSLKSNLILALRKILIALLIHISLFSILFLHSRYCYTDDLYRELEPFREKVLDNSKNK